MVSRQNGKGAILEARELAGLFLLGERLIIHSAHQFDTSLEGFRRLLYLIESTPDFDQSGEAGVPLAWRGGHRAQERAADQVPYPHEGRRPWLLRRLLMLDEAMDLPESTHAALLPTLSARPNPQVWYTGSAVDQWSHEHGVVLARIRERGMKGDDPGLAYFEWSAAGDDPAALAPEVAADPEAVGGGEPGVGDQDLGGAHRAGAPVDGPAHVRG